MKLNTIIMVLVGCALIIGIGGYVFTMRDTSTTSNSTVTSKKQAARTMADVQKDIANGSLLIDVRTEQEFADGHILGALVMPLDTIQDGAVPSTGKIKTVYLYCRSGNRAGEAKTIFEKAGFMHVINLGGIDDVVAIGGTQVK